MTAVRLPGGFRIWVAAVFAGELGAGALSFALTWAASGHGPHVASAVLTITVAPAVILGLFGGAAADRYGPRRVMIASSIAMVVSSAALAAAVALWTAPPGLLFAAAAAVGIIAAFFRPAAGVFPRLFVGDELLGAAMARVGVAGQIARTIGPPLGGMLLGVVSLSGVALLDVIGAAAMLAALVFITPPRALEPVAEDAPASGILSGLRSARSTAGVPALLACVAIVAGAVIPAVILGVPLVARERGWSAGEAGIIEAGWIAGGIISGIWYARRGTAARVWRPMAAGPALVACGLGILALAPSWTVGAAGTLIVGGGVVVFTAHVFPTYILLAPPSKMSRFQSLLIVVQQLPQLAIYPLIGVLAAVIGAGTVIGSSAAVALVATMTVAANRTLRSFTADGGR